jgi:hypothetical protein
MPRADQNIALILTQIGIMNGKIGQIMASNNAMAALSKQILSEVQQLKAELDSQTVDINKSLDNFKAWLSSDQAASVVGADALNDLKQAANLLSGLHAIVQSTDTAATSSDPGTPPANPVNG